MLETIQTLRKMIKRNLSSIIVCVMSLIHIADIPLQGSQVNVKFERKIEDLIEKLRGNKDSSEVENICKCL